jgi:hypothetical protein
VLQKKKDALSTINGKWARGRDMELLCFVLDIDWT